MKYYIIWNIFNSVVTNRSRANGSRDRKRLFRCFADVLPLLC